MLLKRLLKKFSQRKRSNVNSDLLTEGVFLFTRIYTLFFYEKGDNGMITSEITHLMYVPEHMVRIVNTRQAMLYIKHQCTLYDLYERWYSRLFI